MRQSDIIKYYSRPEVTREIARLASSRETIAQHGLNRIPKRPDTISMPGDVIRLARNGATSFHTSEEIWNDPLALSQEAGKKEMDANRAGWDLVIDIDSPNVKYGKIVAKIILQAFEYHGLRHASVKFSGNKGFHIGVPFKALPKSLREEQIELLFPDAPRTVAEYLKELTRKPLSDAIITEIGDVKQIMDDTGLPKEALFSGDLFDPYRLIELDTILIAPRHLFRMAYSLHEKSGLVSVVLKPEEVSTFNRDSAKPECVVEVRDWFLNPAYVEEGEATQLFVQAFDWKKKTEEKESENKIEFKGEINEAAFPPCIKHILQGLEDGRKRALFILLNFFKSLNWSFEKISFQVVEWNKKNKPPLRTGYIKSQLNWHQAHGQKIPPPNCENSSYYKGIGVCTPDSLCEGAKNPLGYVVKRIRKRK